ncbi:hypothetical protein Q2T83_04625 [Fervidibacter sacchari]|uniref:Flagellar assembly protein T C-terminal domain-containing protein n=1 Tax=Candidatus Fervidibacter sacchari TaxID=1448929 RepID=A0ABT2EML1_9BACT|nr:hypothetical protein [Candidatus Fervidibacter sacchari]MCS3919161.1 hypothetical protein [Candidatus Fervidibacter sacchari]WKU17107.1 hypothetical protein Q2T83_04625 [Candidatus Fervidibacter sacchari]
MRLRFTSLTVVALFVATISAAQVPVAFVGVVDESSYGGAVFKSQVAESLLSALKTVRVFNVRDVREKFPLPADYQTIAEFASELKLPAALQAVVKQVTVKKPKRDPQVTVALEATLIPTKMPQLVFKAFAVGKGNNPAEGRAVSEAIAAAAFEVAKQLGTITSLRGQVLLPPAYAILPATHYKDRDRLYDRTVRISLDMTSGLKVGSEVAILKRGELVAKGQVVEVDIGSSLVALTDVKPETQIRTGDEVVVTFMPQFPAKLPLPLQKEREYKRVEHDFAWALAIAGAAIGLVAE